MEALEGTAREEAHEHEIGPQREHSVDRDTTNDATNDRFVDPTITHPPFGTYLGGRRDP